MDRQHVFSAVVFQLIARASSRSRLACGEPVCQYRRGKQWGVGAACHVWLSFRCVGCNGKVLVQLFVLLFGNHASHVTGSNLSFAEAEICFGAIASGAVFIRVEGILFRPFVVLGDHCFSDGSDGVHLEMKASVCVCVLCVLWWTWGTCIKKCVCVCQTPKKKRLFALITALFGTTFVMCCCLCFRHGWIVFIVLLHHFYFIVTFRECHCNDECVVTFCLIS